jgi:cysteine desulfurase
VLRTIGVSDELAYTSLRIGLSKFTTKGEIDEFVAQLEKSVAQLKELSPLWDMAHSGADASKIQWVH